MNESNRPEQDEQIDAPRELIDALADLDNERIFVPPSVDESIMAEARKHLSSSPDASPPLSPEGERTGVRGQRGHAGEPESDANKPSNIIAWSGWSVAIAASVVLLMSLPGRGPQSQQRAERTPALMESADMAAAEEAGAAAPAEAEAMTVAPAAEAAKTASPART